MKRLRQFTFAHKSVNAMLVVALLFDFAFVALVTQLLSNTAAQAAVVVVDSTASTNARFNNYLGSQTVFVSDTTGYTFYRDSNNQCVYSKSTDSGDSWGSAVVVDSQTDCIRMVVWYDQWTPGDSGDYIHITTMDTSNDDLYYNRLDTTNDTLLLGSSPVNATINSGQSPTFSSAANTHAITKATDGEIYLVSNDNSDSYVVSCSASCDLTTSWTEVGTSPLDNRNDHNLLVPLSGGDVMVINRDISANAVRSKIWDGVSWSGTWTTIDAVAAESAEYDGGMTATIELSSGNIYLAYTTDNGTLTDSNDDIRTAIYDGSSWTSMADVLTNESGRGLIDVAIAMDQNNSDVYVAYTIQDTGGDSSSANIYFKESTDAMTSWGVEEGPVNSTPGDIRKPALDAGNEDRLYVAWWEASVDDRFGETLANIGPDSVLSTLGSQLLTSRAQTDDVYLGGTFVLTSLTSNSVSSVTITESGTVDASTGLANVQLYYDLDTSLPYDCASESYGGSEAQFGATDTDGFSAADGVSTFSGSVVGVSPTQAVCFYVVSDITQTAADATTVELSVADPAADITVSGSDVSPTTAIAIPGTTTIVSPELTQTHYHWRNDDGSESAATSATAGAEDTPLSALSIGNERRLRIGVSVEGSTSTEPITYELEYATAAPTCEDVTLWTGVEDADDAINLFDSPNLTDGADTTNIATGIGGITDENAVFLTPNGGVRDTADTTGSITLETNEFLELEFSLIASTTAVEGETYCFRLSDAGVSLGVYDVFPQVTINAEVSVDSFGTQLANIDIPDPNVHVGGGFSITANDSAETVTEITITESGTVDASTGLANVQLYYDLDTSLPYDCASESYGGSEAQFGATDTDGFSAADGVSTFSGSVAISLSQTMCVYAVFDVTDAATSGETVEMSIESANSDVVAGAASVSPSSPRAIDGTTNLRGSIMTQTNYHWRNNDGTESGATSATGGTEDTDVTDFQIDTPIRLRLALSNEGATSTAETVFTLQFAELVTTCSAIGVWTDVDAESADDWDAFDSTDLTHGDDTTNIAEGVGGVSNPNTVFQSPNGAVRDLSASSASTTLSETEFVEYEFSLTSTVATTFDQTYCFRVIANGQPLPAYDVYPEITTASKRDYKIQRGNVILTGTTQTITAGVDYDVPDAANAFIRITNTNNTGAGDIVGGGSQDVEENTAYIQNPDNLETSITFARQRNLNETFIDWEIIEFIGQPDTDNEMIVRDADTVSMTTFDLTATGPVVSVDDDSDVVVFVTGVSGSDINNDFFSTQVTAEWDDTNSRPVFTRGDTGSAAADISYAVVEFTGINWSVQRVEHTYTAAGVAETEPIAPVTALSQAFIHTQKRLGASTVVASLGHEVYLSSIGIVSFELHPNADLGVDHTSVAWVIENTQTGVGAMQVERQSGDTQGGSEPLTISVPIADTLDAVSNSSIFGNSSAAGNNNAHPRATAGLRITADNLYELWRSDTGARLYYRTEIVQWPVADLAIRQNYYRIYTDNNLLTPDDPWPAGVEDLGENTSITDVDDPPGIGEVLRLRMTLRAKNANWPADFYRFKLQFAERVSTCTAIGAWTDVGAAGSGELWRGFAATGTADGTDLSGDPPTPGDLLISVSDVAGKIVHENLSASNTYIAFDGEDVEYDWYVEHNGAAADTTYCFRVVEEDGAALSGYLQYPQIRTADFTPRITNWRWYDDPLNETPSSPAASLNTAPTEIAASTTLALRVVVGEEKSVNGEDIKFRLQFSEDINFSDPITVDSISGCGNSSTWCFFAGGGADNATITSAITGESDGCVAEVGSGCGTHNTSDDYSTGHTHPAQAVQEYSFTIQSALLRASAVYYFRLFDISNAEPVELAQSASYPAVVGESANLSFTVSGLPNGTSTAGVVTGATTSAAEVDFGILPIDSDVVAAQRLSVDTNALEGYRIFKFAGSNMTNGSGLEISNITSTNASPAGWLTACAALADGCIGYHTTDATLSGGSARFAPTDTYSSLHSSVEEIAYSSLPANESTDVVFRVEVRAGQPAGDYTTNIVYIATPVF